eukprot:TRINITY_DN12274_c0_g2_i6.p1 TRINITY_DN12274_c0_g2~~TRINITY_DN12274_c0_g2_i6.p1  ORF type:complete len:308 (+),score=55.13 TRINITY_DN12274_c0_g2_i6:85-1008(+)
MSSSNAKSNKRASAASKESDPPAKQAKASRRNSKSSSQDDVKDYLKEVAHIMTCNTDTQPQPHVVELMHDMLHVYMTNLLRSVQHAVWLRTSSALSLVQPGDVNFALRKQPSLQARLAYLQSFRRKVERDRRKKVDQGVPHQSWIEEPFSRARDIERLAADDVVIPLPKLVLLQATRDRNRVFGDQLDLSDKSVRAYNDFRAKASFLHKKTKQFRDWLKLLLGHELRAGEDVLDLLGSAATEYVATMTQCARAVQWSVSDRDLPTSHNSPKATKSPRAKATRGHAVPLTAMALVETQRRLEFYEAGK